WRQTRGGAGLEEPQDQRQVPCMPRIVRRIVSPTCGIVNPEAGEGDGNAPGGTHPGPAWESDRTMADVVAYQGEPGAHSEEAAHRLFPGASLEPLRTLHQVFDRVAGRAVRAGVVPLENSQAGSINETYDLLAKGDVHIVGEAVTRV